MQKSAGLIAYVFQVVLHSLVRDGMRSNVQLAQVLMGFVAKLPRTRRRLGLDRSEPLESRKVYFLIAP
jgi:hypothetical protein